MLARGYCCLDQALEAEEGHHRLHDPLAQRQYSSTVFPNYVGSVSSSEAAPEPPDWWSVHHLHIADQVRSVQNKSSFSCLIGHLLLLWGQIVIDQFKPYFIFHIKIGGTARHHDILDGWGIQRAQRKWHRPWTELDSRSMPAPVADIEKITPAMVARRGNSCLCSRQKTRVYIFCVPVRYMSPKLSSVPNPICGHAITHMVYDIFRLLRQNLLEARFYSLCNPLSVGTWPCPVGGWRANQIFMLLSSWSS